MALVPYAGKEKTDRSGWHDSDGGKPARTTSPRNQAIIRRHDAGHSHVEIAADYGITRERVRQIVEAMGGVARRSPTE